MNGSDQERYLMAVLRCHAFIPMRSPGSGTGDWQQPDVMAGQQGIVLATELKSGAKPKNIKEDEIEALDDFAEAFWATKLVAVRYKGDRTFYLVRPSKMSRTDGGRYSIPSDESRLPWDVALPYTMGDDGVEIRRDVGDNGVVFDVDDAPPSLADWLDALAADQHGYDVRRGVVDSKSDGEKQAHDDND